MVGTPESTRAGAGFRHDQLRRVPVRPRGHRDEGGHRWVDPRVGLSDEVLQGIKAGVISSCGRDRERSVTCPAGPIASAPRVTTAGEQIQPTRSNPLDRSDEGSDHRRTETVRTSACTLPGARLASSRIFRMRLPTAALPASNWLACCVRSCSADRLDRHQAAPHEAGLEQLGDPLTVLDVGVGPGTSFPYSG